MNQLRYAQFKQEYALELLRIAKGDLESARGLRKIGMGRPENICYHAEQAIEKSLKAVICFRGLPVPLTHDLGILLGEIENKAEVPEHASFTEFTQYASIRRYEEGAIELSHADLDEAIRLAQAVLAWAEAVLGESKT